MIIYKVTLTDEERQHLQDIVSKGKHAAQKVKHANIMLAVDESLRPKESDKIIAKQFHSSVSTVEEIRQRFVEQGFTAALERKKRVTPPTPAIFDGRAEAQLIALACSTPPEGRAEWTMQLLADKCVELNIVEKTSDETVRQVLKKNELKPHLRKCWVIPPENDGDFVAAMEVVLDTYEQPYDPDFPVVCMDEQTTQLIGEERIHIPASPGHPERYDYQYIRNGTVTNFMFFEPLGNWRRVSVRERKTQKDFADEIAHLLDVDFPDAKKVILVMDNLNTHKIGSLYERYTPEIARGYVQRLDIRHTPKHGSWLNAAEIELSVLTAQCLKRRMGDVETYKREVSAWQETRNGLGKGMDWQFKSPEARIKLKRLYPSI